MLNRAARLLPEGRLLPEAVWQRRHRAIVRLGFLSAGLLVLFAWLRGMSSSRSRAASAVSP